MVLAFHFCHPLPSVALCHRPYFISSADFRQSLFFFLFFVFLPSLLCRRLQKTYTFEQLQALTQASVGEIRAALRAWKMERFDWLMRRIVLQPMENGAF